MKGNAEEIFNKAIEITDSKEQAAYLDEACGGDEKLRAQVEALLKWHTEAGDFLEAPAVDSDVTLETSAAPDASGTVIGRYKLLEKVGEGGMATVYMAEQKHPIRRRVALKIIKLGMDTKQVIARFEAERQALAMMDHPNIARVLDAGTTETGRPYFVMELVRGVPITEFCDKNHLTPRERLELFISVCQAVQHAHQKGIIHRDIKPTNIMVTLHDGEPVVKVIDFGIAKAVNQQLTEKTVFTRYSQMIGTPEYMSPEQAEMSGLDIDTRTDVFSLGVLLYELLTGTTPFDSEYLLSKGYSEMQRIIREEEPLRPSTKVSTVGEKLSGIAKHRRVDPKRLGQQLKGDLDCIVMRSLYKQRDRRYESASAFAADIRRYLGHQPIVARPPSVYYVGHKLLRRHKTAALLLAVTFVIIGLLALIVAVVSDNRDRAFAARQNRVKALAEEGLRHVEARHPDFVRALQCFDDALELDSESSRLNLYRGTALCGAGRYREATDCLENSLSPTSTKDDSTVHWMLAVAYSHLGDESKAREHRSVALRMDPDSTQGLILQALAAPYSEESLELLSQAIDRDPYQPIYDYYRGRTAYNLTVRKCSRRYFRMAVKDLSKAIKGLPGDMRPVGVFCRCVFEYSFLADEPLPDRKKMEEYIKNWLKREPENTDVLGLYVDSLSREGRRQAALSVAQKGLRVDPTNPDFPFQLGLIYQDQEYPEAVKWLNKAEEIYLLHQKNIYPRALGYADILGHRAQCYLGMGDEESARRDMHNAYSYGEFDERTFWDWQQPMEVCQALGDEALRETFCESWITLMPECGSAYFHRAALRLEQGRYQEAVSDVVKARQYGCIWRWDKTGHTRRRICNLLEIRKDIEFALAVAQVGVGIEQEGRIWGVGYSQQQKGRKALLLAAYDQLTRDNNVPEERIFEVRQSIAECCAELGQTEEARRWRSSGSED